MANNTSPDRGAIIALDAKEIEQVNGAWLGLLLKAGRKAYEACRASNKCKVVVLGGAGAGAAGAGYENNRE